MIKLIAIDLDGTLLDSQKQLSQENISTLQAATQAGVKIVICTGRPMTGVRPIFDQLGFTEQEYMIINNGCSTYETQNWELVHDYHLTAEELTRLYETVAEEDGIQLVISDSADHYYVVGEAPSDLVTYDASLVYTTPTQISLEDLLAKPDVQFQAMFMGEESLLNAFQDKYEDQLSQLFSTVRSQSYIFEAMPQGATKATALAQLCQDLDVPASQVMAIGDANNDLEMLRYAYHSVAMGNSEDHIKDLCRYTTATNNESGVAKIIQELVL
ncbi:Cof-type HAD-IIB family hydrolase [Streptococcus caprae]|uniref:Cof-type HAD-IIB family hydrolase n=1 Tax=Streptococcus caprae TaxID=1640501 RepID=A0ABV8CX13_9STRE